MAIATSERISKVVANPYLSSERNDLPRECFLCQCSATTLCPECKLVYFCCEEHRLLHRSEDGLKCFSFRASSKTGIGRILFSTRTIKPGEIVLIDPGTVTGPNYSPKAPICLECLSPNERDLCPGCKLPLCETCRGVNLLHTGEECRVLGSKKWTEISEAYPLITPLRLLFHMEKDSDEWKRANQLMDHHEKRFSDKEDWSWYQEHVVNVLRNDLGLHDRFCDKDIHHAIGLMNINAVALQFPKFTSASSFAKGTKAQERLGKGLYPIFAIMSHYCVCNARYQINPKNMKMYVHARGFIKKGEEISVQYLSALYGNFIRRRKIRDDWFFDCLCSRCKDSTERGSYVSAIYCHSCFGGFMLPKDSLDYESQWICDRCSEVEPVSEIQSLVSSLEEELNEIAKNKSFDDYEEFIEKYSETLLHPSHFLLMTAMRNLIQYWTYGISNEALSLVQLEKKVRLCGEFSKVLNKIDPGVSDLRNFINREINYSKLTLVKTNYELGYIGSEEFALESRTCLSALDDVQRSIELLHFD